MSEFVYGLCGPEVDLEDIAVIYLARHAEGAAAFQRFFDSYNRHPAGRKHNLVVIAKGFPPIPHGASLFNLLQVPAILEQIYDDAAFNDLLSYRHVAAKLPHRYIVCLNTFSEIRADNWLDKLATAMERPDAAAAGATTSFESIYSSMYVISKLVWVAQRIPYDHALAMEWHDVLRQQLPWWMRLRHLKSLVYKAPHTLRTALFPKKWYHTHFDYDFHRFWTKVTEPDGPVHFCLRHDRFPNPHLRTNAFMMERERYIELCPPSFPTKNDAFEFESGSNGLSRQLTKDGKKIYLVGANGSIYEEPEWPTSNTFRLGNQENLLVTDNQTAAYAAGTDLIKARHALLTWGVKQGFWATRGFVHSVLNNDNAKKHVRQLPPVPAPSFRKTGRTHVSPIRP